MPEFQFDNSYASLSDKLYAHQLPSPVQQPKLIKLNEALAEALNLDLNFLRSEQGVSVLAGNSIPEGATPIAMAYAGHQFGNWVPQLGDGRAILLGEVLDSVGTRYDIQLKGAGRTPFSRNGDGRAAVGPVVREYIVSEAMHAMGVPTTRALAAIATGEQVHRETALPGAVLTRVAKSHIRVGTFQYFAARNDIDSLRLLMNHTLERHYTGETTEDAKALHLLKQVINKQAELVAKWQSIGFIHGVMNTDNASVAGLTIDYGPCAFLDTFDKAKVFSSIDYAGRYAYQNQPGIAQWNMANLAQCLLPLINEDSEQALKAAQAAIDEFPSIFAGHYLTCFSKKIGLQDEQAEDSTIIESLLALMQEDAADFTNTFRSLSHCHADTKPEDASFKALQTQFNDSEALSSWFQQWQDRLHAGKASNNQTVQCMQSVNPAYIPRNHRIEQVITSANDTDYGPMNELIEVLSNPYTEKAEHNAFSTPPVPEEEVKATFCGT